MTASERQPLDLGYWMEAMRRAIQERAGKRRLPAFLRRVLGRIEAGNALDLAHDDEAHRYLWRLGLISRSVKGRKRAAEVVAAASERASVPPSEVTLLVRLFASGAYGLMEKPVCGDVPQCTRCPFIDWCRYARDEGGGDLPPEESFSGRLRLGNGAALGAAELLALVVSGGRHEARGFQVAQRLLADAGSLRDLAQRSVAELEKVEGVNAEAAVRLRAALTLSAQWASEPRAPGKHFAEGRDFFRFYRASLRDKPSEYFIVVLLDQKNRLIGEVVTGGGGLAGASVDPRAVLTRALREAAAKVAFVHNHPSGDVTPSPEDMEITGRLTEVCRLAGLRVLDHVIIAGDRFLSMAEKGYI